MAQRLQVGPKEVLIEARGPGMQPGSVGSREMLELAAAYLDMLSKVAEEDGLGPVHFSGLEVRDKCVAIAVQTDQPEETAVSVREISRLMSGAAVPSSGVKGPLLRLVRATVAFPKEVTTAAIVRERGKAVRFRLLPNLPEPTPPPQSIVQMRALPVRVGGATPQARFEARGEPRSFTLRVASWAKVREIGAAIQQPSDITARVSRGPEGHIEAGVLLSFKPVAPGGSVDAWREWYRENADSIRSPEEVERDLGDLDS